VPPGRIYTPAPLTPDHPFGGATLLWAAVPGLDAGTRLYEFLGGKNATISGGMPTWFGGPADLSAVKTTAAYRLEAQGTTTASTTTFNDNLLVSLFVVCRPTVAGAQGVWRCWANGGSGTVELEFSAGGAAVARIAGDGSGSTTVASTTTATVGQWCTIAGSFTGLGDGSQTRTVWLNGGGEATSTVSRSGNGLVIDRYGTSAATTAPVGVEIALVAYWAGRAISAGEVRPLHDEFSRGFQTTFRRVPTRTTVLLGGGSPPPPPYYGDAAFFPALTG
jgi:hypothetical protein